MTRDNGFGVTRYVVMRSEIRVSAALVAAAVSTAAADPARKPSPPQYVAAAADAFTRAIAAEDQGDLEAAIALYHRALAIAPHPDAAYNAALVELRAHHARQAVADLHEYLTLAPDAKDRKEVEAMIASAANQPATIALQLLDRSGAFLGDKLAGYVLVDGVVARSPGALVADDQRTGALWSIALPPTSGGTHVVDLVTAVSFGTIVVPAAAGVTSKYSMTLRPRVDGNLVVSRPNDPMFAVSLSGKPVPAVPWRLQVDAGHHDLDVRYGAHPCVPVELEVPAARSGDVVEYVWVAPATPRDLARAPAQCGALTVQHQRLTFAPP